jgi:AraC-like DNA-binding protein
MANTATDTHRPARSRVRVTDRAEMRHFLEGMYGARLRGPFENRMAEPHDFGMTHERTDVGPLAVDMVRIPGDFEASIDPMDRVVTIWATDGKVAGHCDGLRGEAAAGDVTLLSQPGRPHRARAEELTVTSVLMDPSLLAGVAAGVPPGHARVPIRFSSFRPVSPAAGRLWKDTVSYVKDSVLADDIAATPLVLGHVSRLLAAITLSTFPNSAAADPAASDRTDHRPVLLRRAIEFIETNADGDIGLADIAEAVHVTPRAVQYMFRRHLDSTPLQYLRRTRLHHAHRELVATDRARDTVTAIAARWGFMHTGRFAVLYRHIYGQSPHATLRQ